MGCLFYCLRKRFSKVRRSERYLFEGFPKRKNARQKAFVQILLVQHVQTVVQALDKQNEKQIGSGDASAETKRTKDVRQTNPKNDGINTNQIAINMIFSIVGFVLNIGISFFITPYITEQFGPEAYGFVKLANDFTSYASLISVALNSMASRFLMLEREQGNISEAKKYFSSITLANVVLTAVMTVPAVLCVIYLEKFLEIPVALILEVKITFAVTFAAFLVQLLFSTYGNCYYVTNMLSVHSIGNALMTILRVATTILLFSIAIPKISYVAIGGLVAALFSTIYNLYYSKKLVPEFRFSRYDFQWKKLWEVISTGVWNSITRLSQIFSSGLDLLLTNVMIGPQMMGYLSVAKTIPAVAASFNSTVANVFSPNLMMLYARNDTQGLKKTAKTAMKFMCLFVSIPNAILITMGKEFFDLWVPGQPTQIINILSILTIINSCVTGPIQPLYQIFTITKKIRQSSIVLIVYGFTSIVATYLCIRFTGLGVYAVAGVSLIGSLIVALCYHVPYAAKYIGLPKYTFFPEIGLNIISIAILCIVGFCVNAFMDLNASWIMWFIGAILTGVIGFFINVVLVLNKEERKKLFDKLTGKMRRAK